MDGLLFWVTVDYIFIIRADVDLDVNPNEVRDCKWVTPDELRAMFNDTSKCFLYICNEQNGLTFLSCF